MHYEIEVTRWSHEGDLRLGVSPVTDQGWWCYQLQVWGREGWASLFTDHFEGSPNVQAAVELFEKVLTAPLKRRLHLSEGQLLAIGAFKQDLPKFLPPAPPEPPMMGAGGG